MVASVGLPGTQRQPSVPQLAEFLGASAERVADLLEQGKLDAAILGTLRRRGVSVTPTVKNTVQELVRKLERERTESEPEPVADQPSQRNSTATIMFTDVVGSTSLMQDLGDRRGRLALSQHDKIVRSQTAAHGGSEVKSMGDGFMLTFPSAGRGVACAIALQKALAEYNSKQVHVPISVRIGLSVGEPVQDCEDLFGMSVILAARIAARANGGQILISQIAYALTSWAGDFNFRDVGTVKLKGIADSQRLYEVIWQD